MGIAKAVKTLSVTAEETQINENYLFVFLRKKNMNNIEGYV